MWAARQLSEPVKVRQISRQLSSYTNNSTDAAYFSELHSEEEADDNTPVELGSPASTREGSGSDAAGSGSDQEKVLAAPPGLESMSRQLSEPVKATFSPLPSPSWGRLTTAPPPGLAPTSKATATLQAFYADARLTAATRAQEHQARIDDVPGAALSLVVLLQNLPSVYTEKMLLEEMRDAGFRPGADFDLLRTPGRGPPGQRGYFVFFNNISVKNAFESCFQGRMMRESQPGDMAAIVLSAQAPCKAPQTPGVRLATKAVNFCPDCGGRVKDGASFCHSCGCRLPTAVAGA
jgi:hypothetical protein